VKLSWQGFIEYAKEHWLHAILGVAFLVAAQFIISEDVKSITKQPSFVNNVVDSLDKNIVGASYQSYFVIGPSKGSAEYYMPMYISGDNKAVLYLLAEHHGTGTYRKIDILVDQEKIDYDLSEKKEISKNIELSDYIKATQKKGVHDFNENFHILWFRPVAGQNTDDTVTVKVLVNVLGLSKILEIKNGKDHNDE
jgi:hypothetical protein